jgi:hypothetical protein
MVTKQMNLATEQGFNNASKWVRNQLAMIGDGGVWLIPRTGCMIRIVSSARLEAETICGEMEPITIGMMRAQGWQCKEVGVGE